MERSAIRDDYIRLVESSRLATELTEARVKEKSQSENPKPLPPGKKNERHPLRGALKDMTFVPPGVDLTEPADPDWGKVYED
jgi:hypothetical protein